MICGSPDTDPDPEPDPGIKELQCVIFEAVYTLGRMVSLAGLI